MSFCGGDGGGGGAGGQGKEMTCNAGVLDVLDFGKNNLSPRGFFLHQSSL